LKEVDVAVVIILKIIFGGIVHEFVDVYIDLRKLYAGSFFFLRTVQ
jgi:hypothetical protein